MNRIRTNRRGRRTPARRRLTAARGAALLVVVGLAAEMVLPALHGLEIRSVAHAVHLTTPGPVDVSVGRADVLVYP